MLLLELCTYNSFSFRSIEAFYVKIIVLKLPKDMILNCVLQFCLGVITCDDLRVGKYPGSSSSREGGGGRVIVVSKDGNGDSKTVQGALEMIPDGNRERVKLLILPRVYGEKVVIRCTNHTYCSSAKITRRQSSRGIQRPQTGVRMGR